MKYTYVIIGGGAIGLATAYQLKSVHQNESVLVLNSEEDGTASLASGAMLGCFGEVTKYTLANEGNKNKFTLMYAAHKEWESWRKKIETTAGTAINYIPGTYVILNSHGGPLDDENYDAMISALDAYDEPYEQVSPQNIPGLNPNSLARPLRSVYLTEEGSIESKQYLEVLRKACEAINVEFRSIESLDSIALTSDNDYVVSYDSTNQMTAQYVVIATGAYSTEIIEKIAPSVKVMPVLAGNGVAAVTKRQSGQGFKATVRTANRAGSCGLHVVPMQDGHEYLGATNVIYSKPENRMTIGLSHFLAQCAIEQLDLDIYHSFVENWRVGNRPVSLDTMPLIGKIDEKGLFIATGTYRDGLHCSPVIADQLVKLMDGADAPIIEAFNPTRSFTELLSKEDSLDEYAMQAVSGAYENWYRPAYYMKNDDLFNAARKTGEDLYRKLDTSTALHPDILLLLSSDDDAIAQVREYLKGIER